MSVAESRFPGPAALTAPPVVAVVSGRDGVGKSSIVANLGLTLAKTGRRVCVWDFDSGPGNVLFLLGLHPRLKLEQLLLESRGLSEVLLEAQHGLRLVPVAGGLGQHGPFSATQERHLSDQMVTLEEQFDCIVLDTAVGGATPAFLASADLILLVLTPDAACLAETSELVQTLESERRGKYQVLVNRVATQNEAWEVFNRFSSLVQEHGEAPLRLLGFVPRDESLSAAATLQRPVALFPDTDPSARTFLRLADALEQAVSRLPARPRSPDPWMRRLRMLVARPRGNVKTRVAGPTVTFTGSDAAPRVMDLQVELEAVRDRLMQRLGDTGDAQLIAAWIDSIAADYWDHRGESAIDLVRAVARLVDESSDPATLQRLREMLELLAASPVTAKREGWSLSTPPRDLQGGLAVTDTSGAHVHRAVAAAIPASRDHQVLTPEELAEIRRVWAMDPRELDRSWESPLPLVQPPRRPPASASRAHGIDVKRFGPQHQLIDMLRTQAPTDEPLAEWLRRLGAGRA